MRFMNQHILEIYGNLKLPYLYRPAELFHNLIFLFKFCKKQYGWDFTLILIVTTLNGPTA